MLRRCRSCTREEAECISRLMDDSDVHENFINFLAFPDVLAISRGHHQFLHPPEAAQTVEASERRNAFAEGDG